VDGHVKNARTRVLGSALAVLVAAGAAGSVLYARHTGAPAPLSFSCTQGTEDVFSLSYTSNGTLADPTFGIAASSGPDAKPLHVSASVDGKLRASCVSSTATEHTVALRFDEVSGALELPNGGSGGGPAASLLEGTVFVTRDARGHVQRVRFDDRMPEGGRSLVREILALGQLTLPAAGKAPSSWEAHEEDANGPYAASYVLERARGGVADIAKTRTPSTPTLRADALRPRAESRPGAGGAYRMDGAAERASTDRRRLRGASVDDVPVVDGRASRCGRGPPRDARFQRGDERR
jgi:hypothetical protein